MNRAALTLLEVLISLTIFAALMVAVIESSISVASYTSFHERTDDLETEGRTILRQLSSDLSNAAWYYDRSSTPAVALFPKVIKVTSPPNSFGDEMIFLKLRTERTVSSDPSSLQVEHVNLSSGTQKRMSEYASAPVIHSLVLNDNFVDNGAGSFVSSVWEAKGTDRLTYDENLIRDNLRHYRYVVEVNSHTGRGELRRYFANGLPPEDGGSSTWNSSDSQRWGSHIVSLTFHTSETSQLDGQRRLSPNQIRIELELQSEGNGTSARSRRVFQATVALRSITNEQTN